MPTAEKYGVTILMELLNSYGHKDYQCDKTTWGSALCEMVGSERFKLLYDIYHMQIMEGNVIETINKIHAVYRTYSYRRCTRTDMSWMKPRSSIIRQ